MSDPHGFALLELRVSPIEKVDNLLAGSIAAQFINAGRLRLGVDLAGEMQKVRRGVCCSVGSGGLHGVSGVKVVVACVLNTARGVSVALQIRRDKFMALEEKRKKREKLTGTMEAETMIDITHESDDEFANGACLP